MARSLFDEIQLKLRDPVNSWAGYNKWYSSREEYLETSPKKDKNENYLTSPILKTNRE
jgi:hypothetical protein